jgi:hypothetical protein
MKRRGATLELREAGASRDAAQERVLPRAGASSTDAIVALAYAATAFGTSALHNVWVT